LSIKTEQPYNDQQYERQQFYKCKQVHYPHTFLNAPDIAQPYKADKQTKQQDAEKNLLKTRRGTDNISAIPFTNAALINAPHSQKRLLAIKPENGPNALSM
jgi:hypothetical protein